MVVVAVVSGTTRSEAVLFEAARRADDHETTVHVLYVLGLSWYANLELAVTKRMGIPVGVDRIRSLCERRAARLADPILDEFEAVGLVGHPVDEIAAYLRRVPADCVVVDAEARWGVRYWSPFRSSLEAFRDLDVPIVPVH